VTVTEEDHPDMIKGVVDLNMNVFLSVTEGVDLKQEVAKLEKLIATGIKYCDGLITKMNKKGYEEKVPEDVRQQDKEKLDTKKEEVEQYKILLERMKLMK